MPVNLVDMDSKPTLLTPSTWESSISTCEFQRVQEGEWEKGFLIDDGRGGILDMNGERPNMIWTYVAHAHTAKDMVRLMSFLVVELMAAEMGA